MNEPTHKQVRRLRSHFGFSKMPFSKYMWAAQMFDSSAQRQMLHALHMWTEVRGFCLVVGAGGVGKSITLRRFTHELDDARFRVIDFSYLPCTVNGFLRTLSRKLELPMRLHTADLFDAAQARLASHEQERGTHPVLVVDDAEGLRVPVIDCIRRLSCHDLDAEDRFSVLLSGTDRLLNLLYDPVVSTLRSRFGYSCTLRPFGVEDTRNYVRFHLERADIDAGVLTDDAVRKLFQASKGYPRNINQLAIQALILAAVHGRDQVDGDFMANLIATHPLYETHAADR